jgi:tape measure domain-containing protein
MAATIGGISVFIEDDSARFSASMERNAALVENQTQRMSRALGGTAKSVDDLSRKASSFQPDAFRTLSLSALRAQNSVERLQKTILALSALGGGGLGGALAVKTVTDTADRYTLIQNRIASIIPLQKDRAAAEEQIFQIAQATRSSFESTAQLYQRLNLGAKALGASQSEVAEVTKTVQQALQTGGATTAEAAGAAVQLSQALASGTLNGDELRSILENSEVLSSAIAQEFGVTSDKLKEMGQNGELAASRVFRALLRAGPSINEQFERSTPTFTQSLQVLDNAFTRYIGQTDKALGVTNAMAQGVIALANNMQTLGNAAIIAAVPLAAVAANRIGQRIGTAAGAPFRAEFARRAEARTEAETAQRAAQEALGRTQQVLEETQRRAQVDPRSFVESQILNTRETLRKELERENAAVLAAEQRYQAALKAAVQQPAAVATGGSALAPQRQALRESQDELRRAERAAAQSAANDAPVRIQERRNASVAKEAELRSRITNLSYEARRNLPETIGDPTEAQVKGAARLLAAREQLNRAEQETARLAAQYAVAEEAAMAQAVAANERLVAAKAGVTAAERGLIGAAQTRANNATVRSVLEAQAGVDVTRGRQESAREALRTAESAVQYAGAANAARAVDDAQKAAKVSTDALGAAQATLADREKEASFRATALAASTNALRTGFQGITAFLGGPIGTAITAAAVGFSLYEVAQARAAARTKEFNDTAEQSVKVLDALRERYSSTTAAIANANLSTLQNLLPEQVQNLRGAIAAQVPAETPGLDFDAQIAAPLAQAGSRGRGALAPILEQFDKLRQDGALTKEAIQDLVRQLEELGATRPDLSQAISQIVGLANALGTATGRAQELKSAVSESQRFEPTRAQISQSRSSGDELGDTAAEREKSLANLRQIRIDEAFKAERERRQLSDTMRDVDIKNAHEEEDRKREIELRTQKAGEEFPTATPEQRRRIAESQMSKPAKTKETPEERVSEKIKRIREEAEASFLPEADQETLREITKLKGSAEIAKKVRADMQAGRPLSGEFADLRSAMVAKEAAKEYKNIVQEYGNLNQVAPFVRSEQEKLNKLLEMGKIDTQQYGLALADYLGKFQQFKWIDQAADSVKTFGDSIADAFYDGKLNAETFGQAIDNLGKQLFKLALNESVLTPIRNMLRGGLASLVAPGAGAAAGGGGANPFDLSNVTAAEIMHTGGLVGFGSTRRAVPSSLFQDAPHLAGGMRPGEFAAILHQGESVLTKRQTEGYAAMAGALSGMKGGINVTINEAPGTQAQVSQTPEGGLHVDILQIAEAGLADRVGRGQGTLAKAVRQSGTRGNLRG